MVREVAPSNHSRKRKEISSMNYLFEAIKPTRLYIKQCPHCGLKYFGKTTLEDVEKHLGSGTRWNNHLKKHGVQPIHLWNSDWYYDKSISRFALKFSRLNKIVSSKQWANLKEENGLEGGACYTHTEEVRQLVRENNKRTNKSRGKKVSMALTGKPKSKEHRENISKSLKGSKIKGRKGIKRPRKSRTHMWITNGVESKRVKLETEIPFGWKRGQTIDKIWITNGIETKRIKPTETIPQGWVKGRVIS